VWEAEGAEGAEEAEEAGEIFPIPNSQFPILKQPITNNQ